MTPLEFAAALLTWCDGFGGSVTSWKRTTLHNAAVGGVIGSAHRFGVGADVVYDQIPTITARVDMARTLGLHLIPEKDHDHLQPADWIAG